jgi:VanZ family protein
MRYRLPFAVLFFAWLIALLVLTYYPNLPEMKIRVHKDWFRLDYLGHFGFYAGLMILFLRWQAGWRTKISRKLLLLSLFGGLVLGALTEFTQLVIPGRSFNPVDMACNIVGTVVGVVIVYVLSITLIRQ